MTSIFWYWDVVEARISVSSMETSTPGWMASTNVKPAFSRSSSMVCCCRLQEDMGKIMFCLFLKKVVDGTEKEGIAMERKNRMWRTCTKHEIRRPVAEKVDGGEHVKNGT